MKRLEKSDDPDEQFLFKHITLLERGAEAESYGYHAAKEDGGVFTERGYIIQLSGIKDIYRGVHDIPVETIERKQIENDSLNEKLYLPQIAQWIEEQTNIPQQIINTNERGDIRYTDYDSINDIMNMTIIADADINIKSISWSGEYGIGLNIDSAGDENEEKVHVILWTDSETFKDSCGQYMNTEVALNGVLVISNPQIEITEEIIKEMTAFQDFVEQAADAEKPSVLKKIADARKQADGTDKPKNNSPKKSREEEL
jgi:hypothetical protein